MKYFCKNSERTGSCYHEYQTGTSPDKYWLNSSLYLSKELSRTSGIDEIYIRNIDNFDPHSACRYAVTKEVWIKIFETATLSGGISHEIVTELKPWADKNFETCKHFYIATI